VRGLADQHEVRARGPVDQRVVVRGRAVERLDDRRRPDRRRAGRALQQRTHLVVRRLREVVVPEPDGLQRLGRERAHDLVGHVAQRRAHAGVGDRDRDHDARGLVGA
jgi:hypothetical protein